VWSKEIINTAGGSGGKKAKQEKNRYYIGKNKTGESKEQQRCNRP
jgi:hypothetical protein